MGHDSETIPATVSPTTMGRKVLVAAVLAAIGLAGTWSAHAADDETLIVAPGAAIEVRVDSAAVAAEASLDGGLLQPVTGSLRAPESGDHWLAVVSRDAVGNLSPIRWIYLIVDDQAPEVGLTVDPPPATDDAGVHWVPPAAAVTAVAKDALSGVHQVSVSSEPGESSSAVEQATVTLPASGTALVSARAEDRVENSAAAEPVAYSIDGTPPSGSILTAGPIAETERELFLGTAATLSAEIQDSQSGLAEWRPLLDAASVAIDAWGSGWEEGAHEAAALAVDRVGNEATIGPLSFFYDTTAPEVEAEVLSAQGVDCDGGPVYAAPVRIAAHAVDDGSGVASFVWADGGGWQEPNGEIATDSSGVRFRAVDRVENVHESELSWTVDLAPPRIGLELPDGRMVASEEEITIGEGDRIRVHVEDDGCELRSSRVRFNGGSPTDVPKGGWTPRYHRCVYFIGNRRYCPIEVEATDQFGRLSEASWLVRVEALESDAR